MASRQSVKPGACMHGGMAICALSKSFCESTADSWISGMEMEIFSTGHGSDCPTQQTLQELPLGRCDSSTGICTPNAASCPSDGVYIPATTNDECILNTVAFGSCDTDRTCYFSPEDCADISSWTFPDTACTCDRVKVGACSSVNTGAFTCAVDALACGSNEKFIKPQDVFDTAGFYCYLCREATVNASSPPLDETKGTSGQDAGISQDQSTQTKSDEGSSKTKAIIGSSIGATAGVISIIVLLAIWRNKKVAKTSKDANESETSIPVGIDTVHSHADEEVSVLG